MKIVDKTVQVAGKITDKLLGYIISFVGAIGYLKLFYSNNIGKADWAGKKAGFSLSFDCDYTKDIKSLPALLNILSRYSISASFACVGKLIEKYPQEHLEIIKAGHEILNHTYTHPNNEELNLSQKFNELNSTQKKIEIEKCHKICVDLLGYSPIGFRTPHFGSFHTKDIYEILNSLGYKYSSSVSAVKTLSSGLPFIVNGVTELPVSNCPEHPLAIFDSWHSLARGNGKHKGGGVFYNLFKQLIDIGISTNSYINIYFDPQDVVGNNDFKLMLEYLDSNRKDINIVNYKKLLQRQNAR